MFRLSLFRSLPILSSLAALCVAGALSGCTVPPVETTPPAVPRATVPLPMPKPTPPPPLRRVPPPPEVAPTPAEKPITAPLQAEPPPMSLPPVTAPPRGPAELRRLQARPPVAPPAKPLAPASGAAADATTEAGRCRAAVAAARDSVQAFLTLPADRVEDRDWVEDALKITELAMIACDGSALEATATYWRATAFYLHGQYARAALHYRRVAAADSRFNDLDYAEGMADLLEACGRDREGLDAFRLGGLHEASGRVVEAAEDYRAATASTCEPLAQRAQVRLDALPAARP